MMVLLLFLGLCREQSKVGSLRRFSLPRSGLVVGAKERVGLNERLDVVMLRKVLRRCPAGDKKSSSSFMVTAWEIRTWEKLENKR